MQVRNNTYNYDNYFKHLPVKSTIFKGSRANLGKAFCDVFEKNTVQIPLKNAEKKLTLPELLTKNKFTGFGEKLTAFIGANTALYIGLKERNNTSKEDLDTAINNFHAEIEKAKTKKELEELKNKSRNFRLQYPECRENFAEHINKQYNKLFPETTFANKKDLQNLNLYTLGGNQDIKIDIRDIITIGSNDYKIDLTDYQIRHGLLMTGAGESYTIGTEEYADKVDKILINRDESVPPSKITITKGEDSFILHTDPNTQIRLYSRKTPQIMNTDKTELPESVKGSFFEDIENQPIDHVVEILSKNHITNSVDIQNGNGIIEFQDSNISGTLIYINKKLIVSKINNTNFEYKNNKRLLIDDTSYNNAISKITQEKLKTDKPAPLDYTDVHKYTKFEKGQPTIVKNTSRIELCDQYIFSMDEEPFKSMKNGEIIILGQNYNNNVVQDWNNLKFKANRQVMIEKNNDKYIITSLIDDGATLVTTKRKTTPETSMETKIKQGKQTSILDNTHLDLNNHIYENLEEFSKYLTSKIEAQMGVIKPEEISNSAKEISKKYNMPEQDVLNLMARLTQFGNYQQLEKLGDILSYDLNIGRGYESSGISVNNILNYLANPKFQIRLDGAKNCFVIDSLSLQYLENLNKLEREEFLTQVENGEIILVNLDGTGLHIGNNIYSETAFDGSQSLSALTEAVIEQIKQGKNIDEIFKQETINRLNHIFGENIEPMIHEIALNTSKNNTANDIAKQINPNYPTAEKIEATIDIYVDKKLMLTGEMAEQAKTILAKYADYLIKALSNNSITDILKNQYKEIEEYVTSIGKSMDDVYYVYPHVNKSFGLIDYMYAKVNKIDSSKFIHTNGETQLPENKVIVLLDDVVGSGASMLDTEFSYNKFISKNGTSTLIFSPMTTSSAGKENIVNKIKENNRNDKFISPNKMEINIEDFKQQLTEDEQILVDRILDLSGYGINGLCTSFPYMIPDNCSNFSGYLLNSCLNNGTANKKQISNVLEDKINKRSEFYEIQKSHRNIDK